MNAQDLKNSILQLAIQGKLVEQREEEGNAKELLEKIEIGKKQLVKVGKIKKQKSFPAVLVDEIPLAIPKSWGWVRIGTICNVINGFTPSKSNPKFWDCGTIPWFTIADVRNQGRFINHTEQHITEQAITKNSERIIPKDSILLCCTASVGEYAYTNIPLTTNQQFNGLVIKDEYKKIAYPLYIYEFAKTLKRSLLRQAGKTTINFVSVKKVLNIIVPIPPLEEQKRIVAKIEELMPYVEKYDKVCSDVEVLNKKFPEDIQESILQYAIQGKLVEQREEEGTAEELYQQIQEDKIKLIKEGGINKTKEILEITDVEIPFDIPENWKWVRLSCISTKITDGEHKTPRRIEGYAGYYLLSARNVLNGKITLDDVDYVNEDEFFKISKRCNPKNGDLLISCSGSVGRCCVVRDDNDYVMVRSAAMVSTLKCYPEYLMYAIQSGTVQKQIKDLTKQTAQANLFLGAINQIIIPLPPLEEQKRIVEKIEELLPYTKQVIK